MMNAEALQALRDAIAHGTLESLLRWDSKVKLQGATPLLLTTAYQDEAPSKWEFCCKFESRTPVPVDLISAPQFAEPNLLSRFPTPDVHVHAGSTFNIAYHSTPCGVYRIRCGAGPDAREVFCDLATGRFSLGPQTHVEVFAALWGTAALVPANFSNILVRSAVGLSDGSGDYLPYTIDVVLAAGGAVAAGTILPPGVRLVDIGVRDAQIGTSTVQVRSTIGHTLERDYLTPRFFPGLGTPIAARNALINFSNFGATALTLTLPGFIQCWCST